jgi:hypothetical protein
MELPVSHHSTLVILWVVCVCVCDDDEWLLTLVCMCYCYVGRTYSRTPTTWTKFYFTLTAQAVVKIWNDYNLNLQDLFYRYKRIIAKRVCYIYSFKHYFLAEMSPGKKSGLYGCMYCLCFAYRYHSYWNWLTSKAIKTCKCVKKIFFQEWRGQVAIFKHFSCTLVGSLPCCLF